MSDGELADSILRRVARGSASSLTLWQGMAGITTTADMGSGSILVTSDEAEYLRRIWMEGRP